MAQNSLILQVLMREFSTFQNHWVCNRHKATRASTTGKKIFATTEEAFPLVYVRTNVGKLAKK